MPIFQPFLQLPEHFLHLLQQRYSPQVFVLAAHQAAIAEAKLQVTNAYTPLKRKLQLKVRKNNVTLIVIFHIEYKPFSIMKIVTDMQVYDYSIEAPL